MLPLGCLMCIWQKTHNKPNRSSLNSTPPPPWRSVLLAAVWIMNAASALSNNRPDLSSVWFCVPDVLSSTERTGEAFRGAGESQWRQRASAEKWSNDAESGSSERTRAQKCQRQRSPDSASVSERVSGVGSEEATDWVRTTEGWVTPLWLPAN